MLGDKGWITAGVSVCGKRCSMGWSSFTEKTSFSFCTILSLCMVDCHDVKGLVIKAVNFCPCTFLPYYFWPVI